MNIGNSRMEEYNEFMIWLEKTHPYVFKTFHGNFEYPKNDGEQVWVNSINKIAGNQFSRISGIASKYYDAKNKTRST